MLMHSWEFWARPEQILPRGDWDVCLAEAGRGWGKTRFGAEGVKEWEAEGDNDRIALIARTIADVRKTMLEGESGLLNIYADNDPRKPTFHANLREVHWPSGAKAFVFTDDQPDGLRGPQFHKAWFDEASACPNLRRTWDNLLFGMRLGDHPQVVVTCTPKKRKAYRDIFHPRDESKQTLRIIRRGGKSYENMQNLSEFYRRTLDRYKGSRLGRQEVDGIFSEEIEGALWTEMLLDLHRARCVSIEQLSTIVVAVDPAVTNTENSCETGIVGIGKTALGQGYVLGDYSLRASHDAWAREAVRLYHLLRADAIVAEVNNGGDLVEANIRAVDSNVKVVQVRATRGKKIRAEPVSTIYYQGNIHHAKYVNLGDGVELDTKLEDLEDQMTQWDPDHEREKDEQSDADQEREVASPDRVDALVWGATYLFEDDTLPWESLARR
jgi:phage terminase large subunit-like protein